MSIAEIEAMTQNERLETMEILWETICRDSTKLDSPQWHETILKDRFKLVNSDDAKYYTINEAKRRLEK